MADEAVTIRRRQDHAQMPWRNGGGTTFEVAREPGRGESFDWRVSFAEVDAPGPFSPFPGVDRIITLVSGKSMRLEMTPGSGATRYVHELQPCVPFAFAGEDSVSATPHGRTLDLNVMTARERCSAELVIERPREPVTLSPDGVTMLVACLDGRVELGDEPARLESLDVAHITRSTRMRGDGVAAVIRLAMR